MILRPFRPRQILQPGQRFVIGILLPQTSSDGGVGIVAKSGFLLRFANIRKPLMKDLLFGKFCKFRSTLFAICECDLFTFGKRTEQSLQPIGIDGIDVCAGDDDKFTGRCSKPEVERTPKRKLR